MRKQVTFAESQTIHHQEALQSSSSVNGSKMVLEDVGVNFNSGLTIHKPPAARTEPGIHDVTTKQIPKTLTAAPFLKHAALTPAQKEYLYTIAASYSTAHVRNLLTQHYMNVLHRCIRTGRGASRDDLVVTSVTSCEKEDVSSRGKSSRKINACAQHSEKSFLPKIKNRKPRFSSTSASVQRTMKKCTTASPKMKTSPRRARIRPLKEEEEEEEEEEGLCDSLSGCLSSLSVGDWDNDSFSDL